MQEDRWLGWVGLIVAFVIFQVVRAVLRGANRPSSGMARLDAAAERILKERGASVASPIPRSQAAAQKAAQKSAEKTARTGSAAPKPRPAALLPKSDTPAVIRRHGLLGADREPVIQRRR